MRLTAQGTKTDLGLQGQSQLATRSINWPGVADGVLFDFDPAWSTTVDKVGGLASTNVNSVTFSKVRGSLAAEFDGTNYLLFDGAPFAALADLSGGVTAYVVCERTDANATQTHLFGIDDASAGSNQQFVMAAWNSGQTQAAYIGETSGFAGVTGSAALTRNQIQTLGYAFTTTSAKTFLDTTETGTATITATNPNGLDRLVIGGYVFAGLSASWIGRIWRLLLKEGPADNDFASYLQGLYT